jgi:hypothetical protein
MQSACNQVDGGACLKGQMDGVRRRVRAAQRALQKEDVA